MQIEEINKKAASLLEDWDPFLAGKGAYKRQIETVLGDLQELDHPSDLAKRIREIYIQCCGLWIPIEECMEISYKLLAVKFEAKCIIS